MGKYLDNDKLEALIIAYRDHGVGGNELAACFYRMADGLWARYPMGGVDGDDARQTAVICCMTNLHKWVQDRGKAFNYFTTLMMNEFRGRYKLATNYERLRKQYGEAVQGRGQRRRVKAVERRRED